MTLDRARVHAIPLFSSLSDEDAERVARWAEERAVEPGERLVHEGASGYTFFVIEEGTANDDGASRRSLTFLVTRTFRNRRSGTSPPQDPRGRRSCFAHTERTFGSDRASGSCAAG